MLSCAVKNGDHQVGYTVGYFRLIGEARSRIDEYAQPQALLDAVQVTAAGSAEIGKQVDAAQPGGRLRLFNDKVLSDLANILRLAVFHRQYPRQEYQITRYRIRNVISCRRNQLRQIDVQGLQFLI